MFNEILVATLETFYMVILSTVFAFIGGFVIAIVLTLTAEDGLRTNKSVYRILDFVVNTLRSFPFVILMVALFPLSKFIIGTTIGKEAMIVPLSIATAPFIARIIEASLREVDKGVIEAAKSFGATDKQIIFKVMFKEAMPSMVSGLTLTIISVIGYSAMAGAVAGGGLGDVAIRYGYHRYQTEYMIVTIIILIVIVQGLQCLGNYFYKKLSK